MRLRGVLKSLKRSIQKKLFGRDGIVKHSIPVAYEWIPIKKGDSIPVGVEVFFDLKTRKPIGYMQEVKK